MEKEFSTCERCGKVINYGEAYVSISRSIEQAEYSIATDETSIQVIDAISILMLCGACGNGFDPNKIHKIIKAIPQNGNSNQN